MIKVAIFCCLMAVTLHLVFIDQILFAGSALNQLSPEALNLASFTLVISGIFALGATYLFAHKRDRQYREFRVEAELRSEALENIAQYSVSALSTVETRWCNQPRSISSSGLHNLGFARQLSGALEKRSNQVRVLLETRSEKNLLKAIQLLSSPIGFNSCWSCTEAATDYPHADIPPEEIRPIFGKLLGKITRELDLHTAEEADQDLLEQLTAQVNDGHARYN